MKHKSKLSKNTATKACVLTAPFVFDNPSLIKTQDFEEDDPQLS